MRVSEMYTVLRERMVDDVSPNETDSTVLLAWLNQAYLRIQRQSRRWSFLHNRGLIFSSVANKPDYSLPLVRDIDMPTVYAVKDGSSTRIPLCKGDYKFWVEEERYSTITASQPVQLIRGPNSSWILYPTPSAVWHVYGDSWNQPDTFVGDNSEPIWDKDFHDLVWLVTLIVGTPRTTEIQFAESAVAEAQTNIPSIMLEFQRRYLPGFSGMRQRV